MYINAVTDKTRRDLVKILFMKQNKRLVVCLTHL